MTPVRDTFTLPTRLAAIDDARRWAHAHAHEASFDADTIGEVEVALTEALSNVIRHSYEERPGEQLELVLLIDERRLELQISDCGKPFDRRAYKPPNLDDPGPSGYGVYLIEELMDEVSRDPLEDGGTLLRLVRYRRERA